MNLDLDRDQLGNGKIPGRKKKGREESSALETCVRVRVCVRM